MVDELCHSDSNVNVFLINSITRKISEEDLHEINQLINQVQKVGFKIRLESNVRISGSNLVRQRLPQSRFTHRLVTSIFCIDFINFNFLYGIEPVYICWVRPIRKLAARSPWVVIFVRDQAARPRRTRVRVLHGVVETKVRWRKMNEVIDAEPDWRSMMT